MNKSLIALALLLITYHQCLGQFGGLDTDFGNEGIVTVDFNSNEDIGRAVAIQPDGKIVVSGSSNILFSSHFALARLNADGTIDESFGNGGKVLTEISDEHDGSLAVAVQNDNKIVSAGYSYEPTTQSPSFTLVRYLSDGQIDTGFGIDGIVRPNIGIGGIFRALKILENGKVLAAGDCKMGTAYVFVLMCFNSDGSLDTTFGDAGVFYISPGNAPHKCTSIAVQTDDKILVAGSSREGTLGSFAAFRLHEDGILDTSFGTDGITILSISSTTNNCNSLALQADGKILLAGDVSISSGNLDFCLVRLNTDGNLDSSFGDNGIIIKPIIGHDFCYSVLILPNGDIILTGFSDYNKIVQTRFKNTGILDTTFGDDGILAISIDNDNSILVDNADLDLEGKIVIAGSVIIQNESDFFLLRVIPNLSIGMLEHYNQSDLLFYPNPIKNKSTLKFELGSAQQVSVLLTDISGKLIKTFIKQKLIPIGEFEKSLDFTNIEPGSYILTIKTEDIGISIKVIK